MSQHTIKGQLTKEGFNLRTWKDAKGNDKMSMDFIIDYSDNGYSNKYYFRQSVKSLLRK